MDVGDHSMRPQSTGSRTRDRERQTNTEGNIRKTHVAGAPGSRTFAIVSLLGPCRVSSQSLQIQFSYCGKIYEGGVARLIQRIFFRSG